MIYSNYNGGIAILAKKTTRLDSKSIEEYKTYTRYEDYMSDLVLFYASNKNTESDYCPLFEVETTIGKSGDTLIEFGSFLFEPKKRFEDALTYAQDTYSKASFYLHKRGVLDANYTTPRGKLIVSLFAV